MASIYYKIKILYNSLTEDIKNDYTNENYEKQYYNEKSNKYLRSIISNKF